MPLTIHCRRKVNRRGISRLIFVCASLAVLVNATASAKGICFFSQLFNRLVSFLKSDLILIENVIGIKKPDRSLVRLLFTLS